MYPPISPPEIPLKFCGEPLGSKISCTLLGIELDENSNPNFLAEPFVTNSIPSIPAPIVTVTSPFACSLTPIFMSPAIS